MRRGVGVTAGSLALLACVVLAGCVGPRPPVEMLPPPPLRSLAASVATVNANATAITQTLAGGGINNVHAVIHDEGERRTYDLNGSLRYLPPRHFALSFGHTLDASVMRVGSNDEKFWAWVEVKQKKLWWGFWEDLDPAETARMQLAPDMIVAALGLAPLPDEDSGLVGPIAQTDDDRYYKLSYLVNEPGSPGRIQREYWLDRYPPFLPRVVIFRDADGTVRMQSNLDDYRQVGDSAVYAPRQVRMVWPKTDDSLRMALRWKFEPRITADSPAYKLDPKRVPIRQEQWIRVTDEGEVDEAAAAAQLDARVVEPAPATEPAAATEPAVDEPAGAASTEPVRLSSDEAEAPLP